MKLGLRFYLSWILTALVMFSLFYIWHGIFLNDFKRSHFPMAWFITFAAITYLILGAGMYFFFETELMRKIPKLFVRGIVCGGISGFALFMVASIINFSLTRNQSAEHLLMDCVWQISEQIVGAMVVTLVKFLVHDPQPEFV